MYKISDLEKIMVRDNICIRAVPQKITSIIETRHIDMFPEGKIIYLPDFKREMLVIEETPANPGTFVFEKLKGKNGTVRFSPKIFYKSLTDMLDDIYSVNDIEF